VRRHKYVKLIKGVYKYVREYPQDVQPYAPKRVFTKSLKSKDLKQAEKNYVQAHEECEYEIENLRLNQYKLPEAMKVALIAELITNRLLVRSKNDISLPELLDIHDEILKKIISLNVRMQIDGTDIEVFDATSKGYVKAVDKKERYYQLLYQIEKVRRYAMHKPTVSEGAYEKEIEEEIASLSGRPLREEIAYNPPTLSPYTPSPKGVPKISEAYELWLKNNNSDRIRKTETDRKKAVDRFIELFGDLAVTNITPENCRDYYQAIAKLPDTRIKRIKELPIKEIMKLAAKGEIDTSRTIAPTTANKYVDGIRVVIQEAIKLKSLPITNPASGMEHKAKRKYTRIRFTNELLGALLSSPIYNGCKSIKRRNEHGELIIKDALYWIPLLGLYTGARMEELAQLYARDIKQIDGFWVIDINDNAPDKRLKTDASTRIVPIHQELQKLGFVSYAQSIQKRDEKMLFPELSYDAKEKRYGKSVSNKFNRYLKALGIKPDRNKENTLLDFHSFRHTFKTACRKAEIPKEVHDRLTGHSGSKDISEGYGDHPIETLDKWLQKIKFDI